MHPGQHRRYLKEIFKFLGPSDLACNCTAVNSFWRQTSEEDEVWRLVLDMMELHVPVSSELSKQSCKNVYRALPRFMPIIGHGQLKKYNLFTGQSEDVLDSIGTDWSSVCCFQDEHTLITCGGMDTYRNCSIDLRELLVKDLPPFSTTVLCPGMIILELTLFIFGGNYLVYETTKPCQKLQLKDGTAWDYFGDMIEERSGFNPVAVGDDIYIIGGNSKCNIEVYSVSRNTFTELPNLRLSTVWASCFLWHGSIYILNSSQLFEWQPQTDFFTKKIDLPGLDVNASSNVPAMSYFPNSISILSQSCAIHLNMNEFSHKLVQLG